LGHLFAELDVLRFIERAFLSKQTIERTITLVQNPLPFCCSVYFDKGEIQVAFRLVITIKLRVCSQTSPRMVYKSWQ
jgi:hypothetical protein